MKKYFWSFFLFATFCFIGCLEEDRDNGPLPPASYTPNGDGNTWIIALSNQDTSITHEIMLSGIDTISNKIEVQNAQCSSNGWEDTFYVSVTDNSVKWYNSLDSSDCYILLKFPLTIGHKWRWHPHEMHYAEIKKIESISVPAGNFSNCYKIYYAWHGDEYFLGWWAPNVGPAKIIGVSQDDTTIVAELIEYEIH